MASLNLNRRCGSPCSSSSPACKQSKGRLVSPVRAQFGHSSSKLSTKKQQQGPSAPLPTVIAAVVSIILSPPVLAAEAPELFANKCAGCHMNGGNVLAVGATLFPEDLKKNGVESSESLYRLIYSGKGKMPGFGKDCAPKGACTFGPRLADEEVAGLAEYVLDRAAAGWRT